MVETDTDISALEYSNSTEKSWSKLKFNVFHYNGRSEILFDTHTAIEREKKREIEADYAKKNICFARHFTQLQ